MAKDRDLDAVRDRQDVHKVLQELKARLGEEKPRP